MLTISEHNLYGIWKLLQYRGEDEHTLELDTFNDNYGVLIEDKNTTQFISNVKTPNYTTEKEFDLHDSIPSAQMHLMLVKEGKGHICFKVDRKRLEGYFNNLLVELERGNTNLEGCRGFMLQEEAFKKYLQKRLDDGYRSDDMKFNYAPESAPLEFSYIMMLILFEKRGLIVIKEIRFNKDKDKYELNYGLKEALKRTLSNPSNSETKDRQSLKQKSTKQITLIFNGGELYEKNNASNRIKLRKGLPKTLLSVLQKSGEEKILRNDIDGFDMEKYRKSILQSWSNRFFVTEVVIEKILPFENGYVLKTEYLEFEGI